jgi:hypothetical protein
VYALALAASLFKGSQKLHIHRRADSEVALAQCKNHFANNQFSNFLLAIESTILQENPSHTYTQSHIPGEENTVTDRISRNFKNDKDDSIKHALRFATYYSSNHLHQLLTNLQIAASSSETQCTETALLAITTASSVLTFSSAEPEIFAL